jgi:hypothetical protein
MPAFFRITQLSTVVRFDDICCQSSEGIRSSFLIRICSYSVVICTDRGLWTRSSLIAQILASVPGWQTEDSAPSRRQFRGESERDSGLKANRMLVGTATAVYSDEADNDSELM